MKKVMAIIFSTILTTSLLTISAANDELTNDGWTIEASTVNANGGVPWELAEYAIDGDSTTFWHSMINPKASAPHFLIVDLKKISIISGVRYLPRQDAGNSGNCEKYNVYISDDGKTYYLVASGSWANDKNLKTVSFTNNVKAKFVKFEIASGTDGYGTAAELSFVKENKKNKTITAKELAEVMLNSVKSVVDSKDFIVTDTSSQGGNESWKAFDKDVSSFWHSKYSPTKDTMPQSIMVDMRFAYEIEGIRYYPRSSNTNGYFQEIEVFGSNDGNNYTLIKAISWADDSSIKEEMFDKPVAYRFIKITINKATYDYAIANEIEFLQNAKKAAADKLAKTQIYVLKIGSNDIDITKGAKKSKFTMDVTPVIYNNYTLIPLRGLLEQMGATITWIDENQTIIIEKDSTELKLQIEDDRVYKNGKRYNLATEPTIINGRTMVPLRFISEHLGYSVVWDATEKSITISN